MLGGCDVVSKDVYLLHYRGQTALCDYRHFACDCRLLTWLDYGLFVFSCHVVALIVVSLEWLLLERRNLVGIELKASDYLVLGLLDECFFVVKARLS